MAVWFVVLLVLTHAANTAQKKVEDNCVGYLVTGAGSTNVNGCYLQGPIKFNSPSYILSKTLQLYRYGGIWKIGDPGKNETYAAIDQTYLPPASSSDWVIVNNAIFPPPTVTRSNLPPAPPPPPPSPPPPLPPTPPPPPMRFNLVFEDDFNGTSVNESNWNILEQVHRGGVYTRDNVMVSNGTLIMRTVAQNITIDKVNYFVSSGAVNTSGKISRNQGRFEARIRLPDVDQTIGYTLHSSIWLFADSLRAEPHNSGCPQEIDIVEQYAAGSPPSTLSKGVGNLHPFVKKGGECLKVPRTPSGSLYTSYQNFTANWSVFRVDWTPDYIAMWINDELVANFQNSSVVATFTDKMFYALTACIMKKVPVEKGDVFPMYYYVDWVKFYEFV
eukprot:m.181046 g.181046  ORF g.181046 m.181046 type:complete len:387 (-) comp15511_c0_seq4:81-1241(-)